MNDVKMDFLIDNYCRLYDWENTYYGIYLPDTNNYLSKEYLQKYADSLDNVIPCYD
jgi:hypothetical protein